MKMIELTDRFSVKDATGQEIGKLTFELSNNQTIDATGTFVEKEYRSEGVSQKLVDALVKKAEYENKKIIPTCPYIELVFDRYTDKYGHIDAR